MMDINSCDILFQIMIFPFCLFMFAIAIEKKLKNK